MKLIFCQDCHDVVALRKIPRRCFCGASGGYYCDDGLNVFITGVAVPLGFANASFVGALRDQPSEGEGKQFTAFVIPKTCPTVTREV